MDLDSVCKNVLRTIVPAKKERTEVEKVYSKIKEVADKNARAFSARAMFCGSIAKGTWLAGHKDLDLFLLFKGISRQLLEEHGLMLAKSIVQDLGGEYKIAYAEHPYLRAEILGFSVDIVPAFDVPNPARIRSSVDRTPWHVRWVLKNLDPGLRDEVRLLKMFCKGIGIYGSDLKTCGLSGYLCELLIAYHGLFKNFLHAASNWEAGEVIDPAGSWKLHGAARKKFREPLIVIDPVDRNRNVASVLSAENFFLLIKQVQEFLAEPSELFFFQKEREFTLDDIIRHIKKRETNVTLISFPAPDVLPDVLWPQLRRAAKRLHGYLCDLGFHPIGHTVWSDEKVAVIMLELEIDRLPRIELKTGPSIFDRRNSKNFIRHYAECRLFIEKDRWVAETKRVHTQVADALKDLLSKDSVGLCEAGIPRHLAKKIEKDVQLASGDDIGRILRRHPGLRAALGDYFTKNLV